MQARRAFLKLPKKAGFNPVFASQAALETIAAGIRLTADTAKVVPVAALLLQPANDFPLEKVGATRIAPEIIGCL